MAEYKCPHCAMPIYDDEALSCLYCGENLRRPVGFMGRIKYPGRRAVIVVAVALVLLSFIVLIIM